MNELELLANMALTFAKGVGVTGAKNLLVHFGTAQELFHQLNTVNPQKLGLSTRIVEGLSDSAIHHRAEREMRFVEKNQIHCLLFNQENYPKRLKECTDAPILLYYKGNAELNRKKIISMVGTRHATTYGESCCTQFISEIKELIPNLLVISGLAYGIDIMAHRACLTNQLDTVAVLAHGLDRIYPDSHRKNAVEMLEKGGLLTEFPSGSTPERQNFVMRNRIIAGMADATIVVESAEKGGGLITADIAQSYDRECFAFPGRITDPYSKGCNQLIRDNKAALIQSASDFLQAMCWDGSVSSKQQPIQRQLFLDLSEEEQILIHLIQESNGMQINNLVVQSNIPINKVNAILFELEMKGIIRPFAGGVYKMV